MSKDNRIRKQASDDTEVVSGVNYVGSSHDISSKRIFEDPVLCSQFLNDNLGIPALKNVSPEDIEDVSERYHTYLGVEFRSDSVKKIRLRDADGTDRGGPLFLVSLIEHKSSVDYNVAMQILKYMVCIWDDYGKEQERIQEGITKRKYFKHPAILPIVYYEGSAIWSAGLHFRDRIQKNDIYECHIPDFIYKVVRNHDYTNEELLERGDAMSLLMMINKIQNADDFRRFCQSPPEELDDILENTTESIRKTIRDTLYGLLMRMNVPVDEANQYVESVEGCRMGYLFENMEKIDIQEERRKTAQARKETEEEKKKTVQAKKETEEEKKKTAQAKKRNRGSDA